MRPLYRTITLGSVALAFAVACTRSEADDDVPALQSDAGALDASVRSFDASSEDARARYSSGDAVTDAGCTFAVESPAVLPTAHATPYVYNSNPPSSGNHSPVWAAYKTFAKPVPRENYVHNLEHGAIVFVYKCDEPSGCPDVVASLEAVVASLPSDPLCQAPERVRAVVTPDPLLDVPVAAAAWGKVYKASCVDAASLRQFAVDNYDKAPEHTCSPGSDTL